VASGDRSEAVFVGTPWLASLAELSKWGLSFLDFPPHSPMGDMLLLVQGKDTSLDDARKLARELEKELATRGELEQRLRQGQKMEAIGRLAGGIAHDFNNILMAIAGFADFARDDAPPQHPVREWIDRISGACNRASFMTTQLLSFSGKTSDR
jgi:signal transduction histidine kinase